MLEPAHLGYAGGMRWLDFMAVKSDVIGSRASAAFVIVAGNLDDHASAAMKSLVSALTLLLVASVSFAQNERPNVAILVFDNVQIIDFTGPYEVFGGSSNVFTVAPTKETVTTVYGMKVTPDYSIDDHPVPDIVVLPGGGKHNPDLEGLWAHTLPIPDDARIFGWVRRASAEADYVVSVCNGAFILARAGLLDGLQATTTASLVDALGELAPTTKVVHGLPFVDNGKIITSAGLSSGLDAALHVFGRVHGMEAARKKAARLEYDWDESGLIVRR